VKLRDSRPKLNIENQKEVSITVYAENNYSGKLICLNFTEAIMWGANTPASLDFICIDPSWVMHWLH
jgi:hypothetical protein